MAGRDKIASEPHTYPTISNKDDDFLQRPCDRTGRPASKNLGPARHSCNQGGADMAPVKKLDSPLRHDASCYRAAAPLRRGIGLRCIVHNSQESISLGGRQTNHLASRTSVLGNDFALRILIRLADLLHDQRRPRIALRKRDPALRVRGSRIGQHTSLQWDDPTLSHFPPASTPTSANRFTSSSTFSSDTATAYGPRRSSSKSAV